MYFKLNRFLSQMCPKLPHPI